MTFCPKISSYFFHGEENVKNHASASCMEEQALQSMNRVKTKANNFHYCKSAVPDNHSCQIHFFF